MQRQATACKNGVLKVTCKQLDVDFVLQCAPGMNSKMLLLGPACCVGQLKVSSNCAMVSHIGQWSSIWMGAGLRCRTISATEARLEGSVVCESMAATGTVSCQLKEWVFDPAPHSGGNQHPSHVHSPTGLLLLAGTCPCCKQ